jgi:hypothetical protein
MEDTILTLCGRMLAAKDHDEIGPMIVELRDELHQYIEYLRIRLAEYPIVIERRVGNGPPSPDVPTPENTAQKSRSATALTNVQA